jgi:hypothetical protein
MQQSLAEHVASIFPVLASPFGRGRKRQRRVRVSEDSMQQLSPPHFAGPLNTLPAFITNCTFSSSETLLNGSPSTAMMSA